MAIIPKFEVGEFSLGEAFAIGISKSLTEQILLPYIGNSNYKSGAVKLAGAYIIPKYVLKNKYGKIIGTGLAVDGVEDMLRSIMPMIIGSAAPNTSGNLI